MRIPPARAAALGVLLGGSIALAVGRGSLWWFAVPPTIAVAVIVCRGRAWRRNTLAAAVTAMPVAAVVGSMSYTQPIPGAVNSVLMTALALVLMTAVVAWRAALHAEREEARKAQDLLCALRRQREAEISEALLDQRVRLAGHVHDRIGHQLNYAIIRLGLLVDGDIEPARCQELERVRSGLADTLDQVSDLVTLLEQAQPSTPLGIGAVLEAAIAAGSRVEWHGPQIPDSAGQVADLVAGFLAEALANASRHAPGEPVTISTRVDEQQVSVTASNPVNGRGTSGSGTGMRRTRQRVELAGGRLDITAGQTFSISMSLPGNSLADTVAP